MEIILNKDIPKLGYNGDVVTVKSGYARNFLIPQGIAVVANASNRKMREELNKQQAAKLAKRKDDAQVTINKLESLSLSIKVKTGTTNKIFGTVTALQVAHLLKDNGLDIDRRNITIADPIKEIGTHKIVVEVYKNMEATINLEVKSTKGE